jgi:hypothetical protein
MKLPSQFGMHVAQTPDSGVLIYAGRAANTARLGITAQSTATCGQLCRQTYANTPEQLRACLQVCASN